MTGRDSRPIYARCCAEGSGEGNGRARVGTKNRGPKGQARYAGSSEDG